MVPQLALVRQVVKLGQAKQAFAGAGKGGCVGIQMCRCAGTGVQVWLEPGCGDGSSWGVPAPSDADLTPARHKPRAGRIPDAIAAR